MTKEESYGISHSNVRFVFYDFEISVAPLFKKQNISFIFKNKITLLNG